MLLPLERLALLLLLPLLQLLAEAWMKAHFPNDAALREAVMDWRDCAMLNSQLRLLYSLQLASCDTLFTCCCCYLTVLRCCCCSC
jgi:hypothetical protein